MATVRFIKKTLFLSNGFKKIRNNSCRCYAQHYPIDDDVYGLTDDQKQVLMLNMGFFFF